MGLHNGSFAISFDLYGVQGLKPSLKCDIVTAYGFRGFTCQLQKNAFPDAGEPHGILGAQVAATFFHRKLSIPSIVVGIERDFSKERLLRFIAEYYAGKEKVAAFSHLCGRTDIIGLAQELKQEGFITILGGPQARQDYNGEPGIDSHPHRFRGLKSIVDLAFQGPVDRLRSEQLGMRGVLLEYPWTKNIFLEVDWSNIYTFSDTLKKLEVRLGQVLNAIGCPRSMEGRFPSSS